MSRPKQPAQQHSLPVAGVLAGLSALGVGLLAVFIVVMVVWLLAAHGQDNTGSVVRASGSAWLAMHLVPVTVGGNPLGLLPLGVVAIPALLVRRAMVWAVESARPEGGVDRALLVGYATMTYATLALFVSMFSSTSDVMTVDSSAVIRAMVVFGVVAALVVARRSDIELSHWAIDAIRPGLAAGMALYAAGGVLAGIALIVHFSQVRAVNGLMAPNVVDGVFLTALGAAYVPTAATWAMSYLLGVAVHVGTGVVSIHSSNPGQLPAFPLLAMLQSDVPRFAAVLLLVPITLGAVTALALPRAQWRPTSPSIAEAVVGVVRLHELRDVVIATIGACAVTGAFAVVGSGPLGREQLAMMGPDPLDVVIATAQLVGGSMLALVLVPRMLLAVLFAISHRQSQVR